MADVLDDTSAAADKGADDGGKADFGSAGVNKQNDRRTPSCRKRNAKDSQFAGEPKSTFTILSNRTPSPTGLVGQLKDHRSAPGPAKTIAHKELLRSRHA